MCNAIFKFLLICDPNCDEDVRMVCESIEPADYVLVQSPRGTDQYTFCKTCFPI